MNVNEDFPHRIKIKKKGSFDAYGQPVISRTMRDVPAYIDPELQARARSQGLVDDVRGTTIIVQETELSPDDIVVMPDGAERIIRSVVTYDFDPCMVHSVITVE